MAGDPHNKAGKTCSRCPKVFDKNTASFSVPKATSKPHFREYELVCGNCAHIHYAGGEE